MDIEIKVLLLGILKKESDENLNDVLAKLEEAKVFSFKEGKKLLKMLKNEGYLTQNQLTLKGELKAKEVEEEFKI